MDWGVGALGDMGAHLIDHPFWALDLGYPTSVETVSTPFNKASYPMATTTYYEFPARGALPPVRLTWYDGGLLPAKPEELGDEQLNPQGECCSSAARESCCMTLTGATRGCCRSLCTSRRHAAAEVAADHDQPRDELGGSGEGQDGSHHVRSNTPPG